MINGTKGRVKGAAIREFIAWYARERGREHLVAAVSKLPPEDLEYFDLDHEALGILPSTWYPAAVIHRAIDNITDGLDDEQYAALAQDAGAATVRGMMTGLHKIVFTAVMTPKRFVRVVRNAWRLNYDSGRVDYDIPNQYTHQTFVREWKGHHRFLCALNFSARFTIYREMGCRGLEVRDRYCVDEGREECGGVLSWTK